MAPRTNPAVKEYVLELLREDQLSLRAIETQTGVTLRSLQNWLAQYDISRPSHAKPVLASQCKAPMCSSKPISKDMCTIHYHRFKRYGTFELPERSLEARLKKNSEPGPDGCINWTGGQSGNGYGHLRTPELNQQMMMAHRVSYLRYVGPIPDGYEIDHLCFNRLCIRPDHLEAVTPKENKRRVIAAGRAAWQNPDWVHPKHRGD